MKKKCLLIGSVPPPYHGSNIYFKNLLGSKLREDFNIIHHDISDHRSADNLSRLDFVNVWLAIKHIFLLWYLLIRYRPNLVYVPIAPSFLPYFRDGIFILSSAILSRGKIVVHLHRGHDFRDHFYEESNGFVKWFIRYTLSKVCTGIVLGDNLKPVLAGLVTKIVSVPNGLKISQSYLNHESLTNESNKIYIGYLGNLLEAKGIVELIRAAVQILNTYQQVEFLIAGPWRETEEETKKTVQNIIYLANLDKRIIFIGPITSEEKKYEFLHQLDIFVLPSWMEGSPLVILEAMACGLPVIATRVGAIPEVVEHRATGLIIEKKNSDELARAITNLIDDEQLRNKMSALAKIRFEGNYSMEINIAKIAEVFDSVLLH